MPYYGTNLVKSGNPSSRLGSDLVFPLTSPQVRGLDKNHNSCQSHLATEVASVLTYWLYPVKKQTLYFFIRGGSFAMQFKESTEVRLLPSPRNWEMGVLTFLTFAFQREGSWFLKKEIFGVIKETKCQWGKKGPLQLVFKRNYMYFKVT